MQTQAHPRYRLVVAALAQAGCVVEEASGDCLADVDCVVGVGHDVDFYALHQIDQLLMHIPRAVERSTRPSMNQLQSRLNLKGDGICSTQLCAISSKCNKGFEQRLARISQ